MEKTTPGVWFIVDQKPSDIALTGVPQIGEVVRLTFTHTPADGIVTRIASVKEDKNVYRASKLGSTIFYSADNVI